MEASLCASHPLKLRLISTPTVTKYPNPTVKFTCNRTCKTLTGKNQWLMTTKVSAASIHDVSAVADPARVDITWQIVVGAIAGVTPFIVAGIEFSKRIVSETILSILYLTNNKFETYEVYCLISHKEDVKNVWAQGLFSGTMIISNALDVVGFFHGSHGKGSSLVKAPLNSSLSVTRLPIGYCSVFRHVVESVCKEVENLKAK
ncbi:hypothetical protein SCA6_018779 [Theobroma cacao]